MAEKLTPKQEKFIQAYLETGNASEAYRQAYDANKMSANALHREACLLLQHPKISQRLDLVREKAIEDGVLTVQHILDELKEARDLAKSLDQPAAMVSATMGRAKVAGLIIDKKEIGGPREFEQMSDDELRESAMENMVILYGDDIPAKGKRH